MATFKENEKKSDKKSAEIKKELNAYFHDQPDRLNEYIFAYDELQRELKELLAHNPDEFQKQIIEKLLIIDPFSKDEIDRHFNLNLGLDTNEIQKQKKEYSDPLYKSPIETANQIDQCLLLPLGRFVARIFRQRHHMFYQECDDPEKGLWAWSTFKICTDFNIEIPLWVLKYFNTISSDLMSLVDTASSNNITNDNILKALGLKQTVKGGRSAINNFISKQRNLDIYLDVNKLKKMVKEKKLKLLRGQDSFDIVAEHYKLCSQFIKEIYYKEKKIRKD
jgi:hypothetical protein